MSYSLFRIYEDNFEEGLTHNLIATGINAEDIVFNYFKGVT